MSELRKAITLIRRQRNELRKAEEVGEEIGATEYISIRGIYKDPETGELVEVSLDETDEEKLDETASDFVEILREGVVKGETEEEVRERAQLFSEVEDFLWGVIKRLGAFELESDEKGTVRIKGADPTTEELLNDAILETLKKLGIYYLAADWVHIPY